jgi:hypothetical protein
MKEKSINIVKNKTGKTSTYEEIGDIMKLSPQQVHKIEKEAFNKLLRGLSAAMKSNLFDTIINLCSYLGMDLEQAYKKLDDENLKILSDYTLHEYGRNIKGI